MAVHYSNGSAKLFEKDGTQPITQLSYRLIETDPTKYTKKKWWGEFHTSKELTQLRDSVIFRIEFEDGREGDCAICAESETQHSDTAKQFSYHFNGRSKLGRDFRSGK
jgi:hypothetical protein